MDQEKVNSQMRARLLTFLIWVTAILLLMIPAFQSVTFGLIPQGKGGEVVVKPTPAAKKTSTRRRSSSKTTNPNTTNPKTTNPKTTNASTTDLKPKSGNSTSETDADIVFWNSIKDSTNAEEFRAYLKKYPDGQFVDLARERLNTLEAEAAKAEAARKEAAKKEEERIRKGEEAERERKQKLDAALSIADSTERLRKLLELEKQYPRNMEIAQERRRTAQAVAEELPPVIASFLKSLGKVQLENAWTIEYKAKPIAQACGLSVESLAWHQRADGDVSRIATKLTINLPSDRRLYRWDFEMFVDIGLSKSNPYGVVGEGENPAVRISGEKDAIKAEVSHTLLRPQKKQLKEINRNYHEDFWYSFFFAPGRPNDAVRLRDQLTTLKNACIQQQDR